MDITSTKQVQIARKLNVKHQTINSVLSKNIKKSKYYLPIANILGVNLKWLMTGEGEIFLKKTNGGYVSREKFVQRPGIDILKISDLIKICNEDNINKLPNVFITQMPENMKDPLIPKGSEIYIMKICDLNSFHNKDNILIYNKNSSTCQPAKIQIKNHIVLILADKILLEANHTLLNTIRIIGKIIRYSCDTKEYRSLAEQIKGDNTKDR